MACAVLVSLFVSFSLDPMLSAYWADPQVEAHERRNPIARVLGRFNDWFDRQADNYARVIAWALDHRVAIVAIAVASFVSAIVLQVQVGGFGFVPESDRSEINVGVETPPGSNLEYTEIKAEEVARIARTHPEVAYTYTTVGAGFTRGAVDLANVYVRLVPRGDRDVGQAEFAALLREEISHVGGATSVVYASGFGDNQKEFLVDLRGPDATTLTALAEQAADIVRDVPGAVDVGLSTRGQKPELNVEIDRNVAGALGVTASQIAQSLRPAFAGLDAGDWIDPTGETREVMVRLTPEARERAEDIRKLPLVLPAPPGQPPAIVPVEQIAHIEASVGPAQIDHLDRERVVTIGANSQGVSTGVMSEEALARLDRMPLPPGYAFSPGGQFEQQQEVFGQIFAALAFAVLLMYLILVVQFGSFVDPIGIMLSLPLSLIGVVLALLVTNTTLNIMSLIGVMLLMGLVAKNAILLIDFAKWGRERGMDRRTALIEAGKIRLRPIIMTSFALIAGMTPVALGLGEGADFRAPLGRAVIGGVITSTLLTLLVIPTVYEILDQAKEWVFRKTILDGQLKVRDIGNRRTAWYTLNGEYLTDRNDPPLERGILRSRGSALHVRHEQLILVTAPAMSPRGGRPDMSDRYVLASSSGQVLDTIAEYHSGSAYAEIRGRSSFTPAGGGFGPGGLVEVGGESMVVQLDAYRGTVRWSLVERGRLETVAARELDWTPLPVDKSLDLEMRRGAAYGRDPDDLVVVYPPYESRVRGTIAVVAPDGDLWVRARTWSGARPALFDGEYILIPFSSLRSPANVTLPGFTLKHVYDDLLVGVQRDDLGVETVRAYRIHWGEGQRED